MIASPTSMFEVNWYLGEAWFASLFFSCSLRWRYISNICIHIFQNIFHFFTFTCISVAHVHARIVMIHTHDSDAFCIFACVTFVRTQSIIITYIYIYTYTMDSSTSKYLLKHVWGMESSYYAELFVYISWYIYNIYIIIQHFFPPAARYLGVASLINCVTFWTRPRDVETGPLWISHDWGMLAIYHP